jgi:hypothetical protein
VTPDAMTFTITGDPNTYAWCPVCRQPQPLNDQGLVPGHDAHGEHCDGSGEPPARNGAGHG